MGGMPSPAVCPRRRIETVAMLNRVHELLLWRIQMHPTLAPQTLMRDDATMTVIADSKKRVVMPGARPGDVFDVADEGNGHFLLVRLNKPAPPKRKTRGEVMAAIKASKLKFDMSREELREMTREP